MTLTNVIPESKGFGEELLSELLTKKTQQTKALSKESGLADRETLTEPSP